MSKPEQKVEQKTQEQAKRRIIQNAGDLPLDAVLSSNIALAGFKSFLEREYSQENLFFWLDAMKYRANARERITTSPEHVKEEGHRLWNHYLKPGANMEVSLSSEALKMIKKNIDKDNIGIYTFAKAQALAYTDMKEDSLPRFLKSPDYQSTLDRLISEAAQQIEAYNFERTKDGVEKQMPFDFVLNHPLGQGLLNNWLGQRQLKADRLILQYIIAVRKLAAVPWTKDELLELCTQIGAMCRPLLPDILGAKPQEKKVKISPKVLIESLQTITEKLKNVLYPEFLRSQLQADAVEDICFVHQRRMEAIKSLENVLSSDLLRPKFIEFCKSKSISEEIQLYIAVVRFESVTRSMEKLDEKSKEMAKGIYHNFLAPFSPSEVEIDSKILDEATTKINLPDKLIFQKIKDHVFERMRDKVFPLFVQAQLDTEFSYGGQVSLEKSLLDPVLNPAFRQFCASQAAEEHLSFILVVDKFKNTYDRLSNYDRHRERDRIIQDFLQPFAQHEIDINEGMREATVKKAEQGITKEFFDDLYRYCFEVLRNGAFKRFQKTEVYLDIVKRREEEKRKQVEKEEKMPEKTFWPNPRKTIIGDPRKGLNKNDDFAVLLDDPEKILKFIRYCQKKRQDEDIMFWSAIQEYRQKYDPKLENGARARELFETYITAFAPREVELPESISSHIGEQIKAGKITKDIFKTAQHYIFDHMKKTIYPAFIKDNEQTIEKSFEVPETPMLDAEKKLAADKTYSQEEIVTVSPQTSPEKLIKPSGSAGELAVENKVALPLEAALMDQVLNPAFTQYCHTQAASEGIDFWAKCQAYIHTPHGARKILGQKIFNEHVEAFSPSQVDLPENMVTEIERALSSDNIPSISLFDSACVVVIDQMRSLYEKWIKTADSSLQERVKDVLKRGVTNLQKQKEDRELLQLLSKVVTHHALAPAYSYYAKSLSMAEPVDFLVAVSQYEQYPSPQRAVDIFQRFLTPFAPEEVEVGEEIIRQVEERLDSEDPNIFSEASRQITQRLLKDGESFQTFLKTDIWKVFKMVFSEDLIDKPRSDLNFLKS